MRRSVLAVLLACLLVLVGACQPTDDDEGGDSSGGDAASSGPVEVGQPIEIEQSGGDKSTVTVLTVQWAATGPGEYAGPPENGAFLVLDVEWTGNGSYNLMYFTFRLESGQEYSPGALMAGFEPGLQSGDLAGGKVRGYVVFDAPQSAGQVFVSDTMLQAAGSWSIPAA